jgi:aspartate-semialdehyde dehydrogenase
MQPYSAVVLGSTGNVGRQIVNLLAASPAVRQVIVVNRRLTDGFKGMPKVREVVVPDMDKLAEAVEPAVREAGAAVGFCAIGIGKGSQKMPEAEARKIEVQYPEAFAKVCNQRFSGTR